MFVVSSSYAQRRRWLGSVVALLLLVQVSAFRTVVDWGQSSLRPPGSWIPSSSASMHPFNRPDFMYTESLGGQQVSDIRFDYFGSTLVRTTDNNYFIAGLKAPTWSRDTRPPYWLTPLNFTGTSFEDEITARIMCLASAWPNEYLRNIQAIADVGGTHNQVAFSKQDGDWGTYSVSLTVGGLPRYFACHTTACFLVNSLGEPLVWGKGSNLFGPNSAVVDIMKPSSLAWTSPPDWNVRDMAVGLFHAAALNGPSTVVSWGSNQNYQFGTDDRMATSYILNLPFNIADIAAGHSHTLVLSESGKVFGWGASHEGQLGTADTSPQLPIEILGLPSDIVSVHGWGHTSMAITSLGTLWMWGSNQGADNIEVGSMVEMNSPLGVFGDPFSSVLSTHIPFQFSHLPPGATAVDVVPLATCRTPLGFVCRIAVVVDVPTPPVFTTPTRPDPIPTSVGNQVVITWGSRFFSGNVHNPSVSSLPIPRPSVADLPRSGNYHRLWAACNDYYVQDRQDGSLWTWGAHQRVNPFNASRPIPSFIHKPVNSKIDLGDSRRIVHLARVLTTSATMFENDPNLYINDVTNGTRIVRLVDPSLIKTVVGGGEVIASFAILFSNGSLYTTFSDGATTDPVLLGHSTTGGLVDFGNTIEIWHVARSSKSTAVFYKDAASSTKLATFGYSALGAGPRAPSPILVDIEVSGLSALDWHNVTKLAGGTDMYVALLDTGDLISWSGDGGLSGIRSFGNQLPAVLLPRNQFAPAVVSDFTVAQSIVTVLMSDGKVYVFGKPPTDPLNLMKPPLAYPSLENRKTIDSFTHIPIDEFGGVTYKITSLAEATTCSPTGDNVFSLAYAVIAEVIHVEEPTPDIPSNETLHVYGFGDTYGSFDYITPSVGPEVFHMGPRDMHHFQREPQRLYGDFEFPFNVTNAMFTFGSMTSYALHQGDLWVWGHIPTGIISDTDYDDIFSEPIIMASNVVSASAFSDGILLLQNDGSLSCAAIATQPISTLCPTSLGAPFMSITTTQTDIRTVSCGTEACVTIGDSSIYFYHWPSQPWTSPHILSRSYVSQVIIAGFQVLPNEPYIHYRYSEDNGATWVYGFGTMSSPDPTLVNLNAAQDDKFVGGGFHVMVLQNGEIYGWGQNYQRQLSASSTDVFFTAIRIFPDIFTTGSVRDIGAANMGSLALMQNGDLYTWGVNGLPLDQYPITTGLLGQCRVFCPSQTGCAVEKYLTEVACHRGPVIVASGSHFMSLFSQPASSNINPYSVYGTKFQPFMLAGIPEPIVTPTSTVITTCSGNPPATGAVCLFVQGNWKWVLTGIVSPTMSSPLVVTGDVIIEGNLVITDPGSLIIYINPDGSFPLLNVTGCAQLQQPITIVLSNDDLKTIAKSKESPHTVLESGCPQDGDLTKLVHTSSPKSCRKASSTASQTETKGRYGLSVLLKVKDSACNTWWIVLASTLGGIFLLMALSLATYALFPKLRRAIAPYNGSGI